MTLLKRLALLQLIVIAYAQSTDFLGLSAPTENQEVSENSEFEIVWDPKGTTGTCGIILLIGNTPNSLSTLWQIAYGIDIGSGSFAWPVGVPTKSDHLANFYALKFVPDSDQSRFQISSPFRVVAASDGNVVVSASASASDGNVVVSASASASDGNVVVSASASASGGSTSSTTSTSSKSAPQTSGNLVPSTSPTLTPSTQPSETSSTQVTSLTSAKSQDSSSRASSTPSPNTLVTTTPSPSRTTSEPGSTTTSWSEAGTGNSGTALGRGVAIGIVTAVIVVVAALAIIHHRKLLRRREVRRTEEQYDGKAELSADGNGVKVYRVYELDGIRETQEADSREKPAELESSNVQSGIPAGEKGRGS